MNVNNNGLVVVGASGPLTVGTIKKLQQILNLSIDGIYGNETVELVKEYQKSNSLVIDGIVGNGTWQNLLS
ncbi:peptidoglycan-binding protein [Clostridium estertheticum]|uniref:peptidoglycan-binding domain-containing protein n=1 Tax=Clostridium estertheticum TaxID=238834 RepID=UPI001C0CD041|nr:peptidoglycan-binding domain-containing protein [Clostridium estertheticum]MBU3217478.1 peptidoglycan-binding protein [Clostridium estertheticum]WAG57897.1 peptidoglycan-binding protein [Clostridium estertheticum]